MVVDKLTVKLLTFYFLGSSRRFRLKAMQSSKSCSQASSFTCHVPVDSTTQEVLPGHNIVCRGVQWFSTCAFYEVIFLYFSEVDFTVLYIGGQSRRSCSSNSTRWSAGDNRGSENTDDLFENGGNPMLILDSLVHFFCIRHPAGKLGRFAFL